MWDLYNISSVFLVELFELLVGICILVCNAHLKTEDQCDYTQDEETAEEVDDRSC